MLSIAKNIKQGYDRPVRVHLKFVLLVLMKTVMTLLVSTGNWSPSIGGLLKPIHPDRI